MNTTRKIAIGLGLAGGALLTAYLLTGDRKQKTKDFITKAGKKIRTALDGDDKPNTEEGVNYV